MKKSRLFLPILLCLSFLFSACAEKQKKEKTGTLSSCDVIAEKVNINGHEVVVCDLSLVKDTFNISMSFFISDFKMVRLENSEEALVSDCKLWVSDKHIGVYSYMESQYKLFDQDGKFLANIGSQGQGPNEYFGVYSSYFDETNEKVYLLPIMGKKLLVFDFEGKAYEHIPLSYQVNKGEFCIDPEEQELTVFCLPFETPPSVLWKQDFKGNILQEIDAKPFAVIPGDYSNEIMFQQSASQMDYSFFYIVPRPDTLYHYDSALNQIAPVLTLKYKKDEIPMHEFIELENYYIVELTKLQYPDKNGNFITPQSPSIIIDKKTLRGCYFNLKYNSLGGIDGPVWHTYKKGYIIASMYPYQIKEQWKKALQSNLSPEMKQKIRKLNNSITEDDNNIILIGKLK